MANFRLFDNQLTWAMPLVGEGGTLLGNCDVVVPLGEARQAAMQALVSAQKSGADMNATVRRELDANEDRIKELLRDIRSARAKEEIDKLSRALTTLVEFARYLQTAYVSPDYVDEGSINIVRTVTTPPGETLIYVVMFERYFFPTAPGLPAMKPRVFHDEDSLLAFLVSQVQIEAGSAKTAIEEAEKNGSSAIPNVRLTKHRRLDLGLA